MEFVLLFSIYHVSQCEHLLYACISLRLCPRHTTELVKQVKIPPLQKSESDLKL